MCQSTGEEANEKSLDVREEEKKKREVSKLPFRLFFMVPPKNGDQELVHVCF